MSLLLSRFSGFRERLARRRLPVVPHASTFDGDKLAEAAALHAAGYDVAAVCVARGAVERRLREHVVKLPEARGRRVVSMGLQQLSAFLYHQPDCPDEVARGVQKFGNRCNKAAHGHSPGPGLVDRVLAEAAEIVHAFGGGAS